MDKLTELKNKRQEVLKLEQELNANFENSLESCKKWLLENGLEKYDDGCYSKCSTGGSYNDLHPNITSFYMWVSLPTDIDEKFMFEVYESPIEDQLESIGFSNFEQLKKKIIGYQWPKLKKFAFVYEGCALDKDAFNQQLSDWLHDNRGEDFEEYIKEVKESS